MKSASEASEDAEVLLPEVVGALLAIHRGPARAVTVIPTETAASGDPPWDLALVQGTSPADRRGERPGELWPSVK